MGGWKSNTHLVGRGARIRVVVTVVAMVAATMIGSLAAVAAESGDLDLSFGDDGKVITDFGFSSAVLNAVALQDDGKVVAVGSHRNSVALVRYLPDGRLDPDFGSGGIVIWGSLVRGHDVVIHPDGKIVVAVTASPAGFCCRAAVARFLEDGSPDPSFGVGGYAQVEHFTAEAWAVALQSDGAIVVGGNALAPRGDNLMIFRLDPTGQLDRAFGENGSIRHDLGGHERITSLVIAEDGKIVGGGSGTDTVDFLVVRYTADGAPDLGFGVDGVVRTDLGSSDHVMDLALQPDGKLVAVGTPGSGSFALARYEVSGALDDAFGVGGVVLTDFGGDDRGYGMALQPDGKIITVGFARIDNDSKFAIARFQADGELDRSFGIAGRILTDFGDQYDPPSSCPGGRDECSNDIAVDALVLPDGRIVVGGRAGPGTPSPEFAIARYLGEPATTGTMPVGQSLTLGSDHFGNVVITDDDVVFDCGGFTIHGNGAGDGINLAHRTGVTVQNCEVMGFHTGIRLQFNSTANTLMSNQLLGNSGWGVIVGEASYANSLVDNVATSNGAAGFAVFNSGSDDNVLTGNRAAYNGRGGFVVAGGPVGTGIFGNTASDNGESGFAIWRGDETQSISNVSHNNLHDGFSAWESFGWVYDGNESHDNRGFGIGIWDSTGGVVTGNNVAGNANDGIHLGAGSISNAVAGNVVADNFHGISLSFADGNEVTGNTVETNTSFGIVSWGSDRNIYSENQAIANGAHGIHLGKADLPDGTEDPSEDNTITGNIARSNEGGISTYRSVRSTIADNRAVNNEFEGFVLAESSDSIMRGNHAAGNGVNGFAVWASSGNTLEFNISSGHSAGGANDVWGSGFTFGEASDNQIVGNTATENYHGFRLGLSDGNTFTANQANTNVVGFDIVASDWNWFEENTASYNAERSGFELRDGSSNNTLVGNTADHNNVWAGFAVYEGYDNVIEGNSATKNKWGFAVWSPSSGNEFRANYGRNAWLDQADWTAEGENIWEENTFKWIQGSGGWR